MFYFFSCRFLVYVLHVTIFSDRMSEHTFICILPNAAQLEYAGCILLN